MVIYIYVRQTIAAFEVDLVVSKKYVGEGNPWRVKICLNELLEMIELTIFLIQNWTLLHVSFQTISTIIRLSYNLCLVIVVYEVLQYYVKSELKYIFVLR